MKNLFVLILIAFCWSCGSETAQDAAAKLTPPLPNTPETVARKWQEYVDLDKFDDAAKLSTPNAKEWLLMIEKFLDGLPAEEAGEIILTNFTEMNCIEKDNAARCGCLIKEEDELIADTFILHKIDGQWMVDVPEEVIEESEGGSIDEFIDSLMQVQ
ncbi:MAG: hypothetical protein ACI85O_000689 [Saprospiraceae bacterium]|jgi:hypothetical protein